MFAYAGKILRVNLTTGKISTGPLSEKMAKEYIGGIGLGIRLLMDNSKPGTDPFDPGNPLIFATGPLSGTMGPTAGNGYAVVSKSPATGGVGEAKAHGFFGPDLKRAGYDAVIITGKADKLSYLWIDDDNVQIMNAEHMTGKSPYETDMQIREELGDYYIRVSAIGEAGEKLCRIACIINDEFRAIGRTGMGAVMGSKNLKAVCFRGTKGVKVASPVEFYTLAKKLIKVANGPATAKYRDQGTPAGLLSYNKLGMFPVNNHREGSWDKIETIINGEVLNQEWVVKKVACSQCSIGCDHLARVPKNHPDYPNLVASIDVELVYGYGTACGNSDWPTIFKCVTQCDDLGIDAISGGVTCAMACDLYEEGIITKEDLGYELPFGSTKNLVRFNEEMILGKGFPGEAIMESTGTIMDKYNKMTYEPWKP